MPVLSCQNISKAFGGRLLFENVSFLADKSSRKALIGDNGTGKSTIMKMLAGELAPDTGSVAVEGGVAVGYLPQDSGFEGRFELLGSVACVNGVLAESLAALREREEELRQNPDSNRAAAAYADAVCEFEALGGPGQLERARKTLLMLGFAPQELDMPPAHLSGGQKTRAHLARLLSGDYDLLLLDEPTNHLDTEACERFVDFLNNRFAGAAVIISHDRYFLDQTVSGVLALEGGSLKEYRGNWSEYRQKKKAEDEALRRQSAGRKKTVDRMEQAIMTLFSHRNFSARDSMVKKLERIRPLREISDPKRMSVRISSDIKSGREVLRLEGIGKRFGDKLLFEGVDHTFERGSKTGICGPNGSGKSTFVKILCGDVAADSGTLVYGANVRMAYFAQEFDTLDPGKTVLEELLYNTDISSSEARRLLGQFLFSGDDAFKTVEQLSGGEKCRLSLAKIMAEKPNLLLLDEPTNHLDAASCEILENAVKEFDGTVIAVSHDRYFLEQISAVTAEIRDGRFTVYPGPYSYYWEKRRQAAAEAEEAKPAEAAPAKRPPNNRDLRLRLKPLKADMKRLEEAISRTEERMAEITLLLGDEAVYRDGGARDLSLEYTALSRTLEEQMQRWENLQQTIDNIEAKIV